MSTLSGIAAKGEKGKSKFQSLDINNIYTRASKGESLETHQHKNLSSRRHGMQSLGKIPSARRAPANLPSLKAEYSGNDPAVSLVPSGGTGWGNKPGETGPPPTSTQVPTSTTPTPPSVTSAPPATVAVSTTSFTAPAPITTPAPAPIPIQNHGDKSWSSITSSGTENTPIFLAHQSPYFQQEFPSLSGDAAASGSGPNKPDTSHLPGLSLRPQTEGSWIQGGSRPQAQMAAGVGNQQGIVPAPGPLPHLPQGLDVGGGRNNLVPSGAAVGPAGPIPPTGVPPHHYRIMPPFMLRHNNPSGGFPPNYQHGLTRPRFPYPPDTRFMPPNNRGPTTAEQDELTSRPIIKEEDLKVMDEISRDTGWAVHDEIDYNQTLSFSDEEGAQDDDSKVKAFRQSLQFADKRDAENKNFEKEIEPVEEDKLNRENSRESISSHSEGREAPRAWQQPAARPVDFRQGSNPAMMNFSPQQARPPNHPTGRQGEDDETWRERRRIQHEEVAIAVVRAKQRKEEEEKRYEETRQAANRKLQKLEEKMRSKPGLDKDENTPSPPLSVQHGSNALLPDWEKDKEKNRSRKNSEVKDETSSKDHVDNFKNVQADAIRGGFGRDRERDRDRELRPEREGPAQNYRPFQNNIPPRFLKQAAERPSQQPQYYRQNSGGSPQPPTSGQQPPYDIRWPVGQTNSHFGGFVGNAKNNRNRDDLSDWERDDSKEVNRDRGRNSADGGMDRERVNRPPSRDNREKSLESNWTSSGYPEETSHSVVSADKDPIHEYDNRQYEKCQEFEEFNKEKEKDRFYDENIDLEKMSVESLKPIHLIQEDPFHERDGFRENKLDSERNLLQKSEFKDQPERPQRPNSRDSRASRESRNSRDSIREDNKLVEENNVHDNVLSWADSTYEVDLKEDKRRKDIREDRDMRRDLHMPHQRHMPGPPITREKLEASELKCDSTKNQNLVPLVRTDKKNEVKKVENQWELGSSSGDAWSHTSASPALPPTTTTTDTDSWADLSGTVASAAPPEKPQSTRQEGSTESQQAKIEDEVKNATKTCHQERVSVDMSNRSDSGRDKMNGRGGFRGMRHDTRGPRHGWGGSHFRGAPSWRGADTRGRRSHNRRPTTFRDWGHSESEASADEVSVSTESGKEDKRQEHDRKPFSRSPKQGMRRSDKDDRFRDGNRKEESDKESFPLNDNRRHEKRGGMYDGSRMSSGFEPRGEPSRRGRGASFKSKSLVTNVGRRMDGYGPPTSKRPFTSESTTSVHDDKKTDGSSLNHTISKEDVRSEESHDSKMKLNQQQLSAGIIGNALRMGPSNSQSQNVPPPLRKRIEGEFKERKSRDGSRRGPQGSVKSGSGSGGEVGDENWETTSEASEQEDDRQFDPSRGQGPMRGGGRRQSQPNRNVGKEKRSGGSYERDGDQSSRRSMGPGGPQSIVNGSMKMQGTKGPGSARDQGEAKPLDSADKKPRSDKEKRNNLDRIDLCNTASVVVIDDQPEGTVEEDQTVFATDNNGFQEVRSKKNVKDTIRQQKEEPQKGGPKEQRPKSRPPSSQSPGPPMSAAPVNKGPYDRQRSGKLPPRLAKIRETNRLQKMVQQQQTLDVSELNKINQSNVAVFPNKDLTSPAPPPAVNAWDKPFTTMRTVTPPAASATVPVTVLAETCSTTEMKEHIHSTTSSQRSSPNEDKAVGKHPRESTDKAVLDGTSPPVQTIIFENTNYKSTPVDGAMKSKYSNQMSKPQRPDKSRERKLEEENVTLGFKSPGPDMKLQDNKADPIQMPISYNKNEDNADMKLDFRFDSDLSQLTDDKTSKTMVAMQMTRSIQMSAQSSTAELQFKLASVKKVWENPPATLEHSEDSNSVTTVTSFTPTFGNSVDESAAYGKAGVQVVDSNVGDDGNALTPEGVYNSGQQLQSSANSYNPGNVQNMIKPDPSSNVCKVKPQPQAAMHPHSGPLSPPSGAFNSSAAQPSQHINYQIRDTKSEPKAWIQIRDTDSQKTASYNQSLVYTYLTNGEEAWHKIQPPGADPQQYQQCRPNMTPPTQYGGISAIPSPPTAFTPQAELYQTFQINNPQVMGSQGRSQFSQFPSHYMSQGLSQTSGFSQQSMYLHQTAPPPPTAGPPDLFQTQLSQYRIQPPAYGTSQQLGNNPNTVLISSSSNSLMSASVKPSPQPIGAIGSKAASYQTTSQPPPSQLYIYSDPQMLNQTQYLQNSQLVQRQASNVVSGMPPSSASYYSASTGGGATGFYQPANSTLPGAHQTAFGLQAFNTQSQAATPAGMGSFGSTLPRLILQNPVQAAVGSRVQQAAVHRSNSPAPPRATTSSPRINKMSHRQPSS